jgi:hypothetical protein
MVLVVVVSILWILSHTHSDPYGTPHYQRVLPLPHELPGVTSSEGDLFVFRVGMQKDEKLVTGTTYNYGTRSSRFGKVDTSGENKERTKI